MRDVTSTYKVDESRAAKAIFAFPPFAGLNHERVLRQKTRIGRIIGLTQGRGYRCALFEKPVQAGYAVKRDLARIDVAKHIESQGVEITDEVRDWFIKNHTRSPYVPGTNRKRISKSSGEYAKPNLQILAEGKFLP